jgi:hypothetical protein
LPLFLEESTPSNSQSTFLVLKPKFNKLAKDEKYKELPLLWADFSIQRIDKDFVKSIGIKSLPTVQFYANGKQVDTFQCGPAKVPVLKKKLAAFVDQNIPIIGEGLHIDGEHHLAGASPGIIKPAEFILKFRDPMQAALLHTRLNKMLSLYPPSERPSLKYDISIQLREDSQTCQFTLNIVCV